MKPLAPFLAALLLSLSTVSGQDLKWNTAPKTGFVFQITNKEAERLLTKSSSDTIINSMLHTEVATFNVDSGWTERPEKGHFILARIVENKLHCEYTSVFPYQVMLLKAYNALALQVVDLQGNVREDAKVKFRTRRIRFDRDTKTYRIDNEWFKASSKFVTVEVDGFRSVFNIEKHEVPLWDYDYYVDRDDGPDFYSYMITDKNKYKPGERVRFKSYALTGSRTPIRRDLEVWLLRPQKRPLQIGTVSPHRPGSFVGEIQLHDSLELVLDQYYSLHLWDKTGRVVAQASFKYEDYELQGNGLKVDLETRKQFHPASNTLTIKATSENGLILKDARAYVTILTENIREVFQPVVVLPDTLMFRQIELDGDAETEVEIPSWRFGKSNTSYAVHVTVLNSQNQRMEQSVSAVHYFSQYELEASYSGDSLVFRLMDNGNPKAGIPAKIFHDDEKEGVDITLPHREKINPATAAIKIQSELVSRTIRMTDMLPKLTFIGGIEKDSFSIAVENPQKIPVSWYVYQGSTLLQKGSAKEGEEIEYKSLIEDRSRTYYVELLYSFGGVDHITTKEFEFRDGALEIALNIPDRVYPGQKVDAVIEVTDDEGDAVSGVDLTAMATTAKLNYYPSSLPYYRGQSNPRSEQATYSKRDVNKRHAVLQLDYKRWNARVRLDTMRYYRFAYPGRELFSHQQEIADSTQFAAYVMKDGAAKHVYAIEVDREPVFYSWTNHPKEYSFYVEPDKWKQITLRLHDRVLIMDSMRFEAGRKTIVSFDLEHLPADVYVHRMKPEIKRLGWGRKEVKWKFSEIETSRHMRYIAAFASTRYPAYLEAGNRFVPVSRGQSSMVVAGPIVPMTQTYTEKDYHITYRHAGGFLYSFEGNVVYKTDPPELIPTLLRDGSYMPVTSVDDLAVNKTRLLAEEPWLPEKWHPRVVDLVDHSCRVKVLLPYEEEQSGVAAVLFQECGTDKVMSPCKSFSDKSHYYTIPRGCHNTIVLYNNGSYLKIDSVNLKSFTSCVADMNQSKLQPADSLSRLWIRTGASNCFRSLTPPSRTLTFEVRRHNAGNTFGVILGEDNMPLPGVNILVKGTGYGTVSDISGRFVLEIPENPSTIVFTFIGYQSQELEVRPGSDIAVVLVPDVQMLQEVVVAGYGVSYEKKELGYSTVFQGRVAGLTMLHQDEVGDAGEEKKVVPESEDGSGERRLYEELMMLRTIRSQFSDVGFWEPKLFTDRHGKSKFTVTFPDDITRWDAVVFAMNRQLQTGTLRKSIRSYKPLMAEVHVPQFLTVGDSVDFLGKVLNYTSDGTIHGRSEWIGANTVGKNITFDGAHTERLAAVVASADTVTVSYSFTRDDGYFDGEKRKVPVVEQGTVRANGTLSMLKNDDEIHVQSTKDGVVNVEIADNPVDVYAEDVRYLLHYRYDCNEQLASKLIGLLNHKQILQFEGKHFKYDRDVRKIIQRLLKNQNAEFLWSWWDVSPNTSFWMSAHILRALKAADDAGYAVNLDVDNLMRKATYKYDMLKQVTLDEIDILHALATWDAKLDYVRYVKMLDWQIRFHDSLSFVQWKRHGFHQYSMLNEKLLLLEIRQLQGLPFVADSLLRYQKRTILGELYFTDGRPERYWYSGELSHNVTAYRIARRDSTLKDLSASMQMYFLSHRRKNRWNTYEASNVLMAILPDLLVAGSTKKAPATVSVAGKVNEKVQKFPYKLELSEGEEVRIRKESGTPLYCMQYIEERVTKAHSATDAFTIKTSFDKKSMKAGTPARLRAVVTVKRDAKLEHVMIEIPIPGGCSYADKGERRNAVETHREYFKEKTVIFCENMAEGTYMFEVELLPRFTGSYYVNPAQVSLMYFPVVNANNDISKVRIGEE